MNEHTPWFWKVPKGCFMEFANQSQTSSTVFYIDDVIPHDEKYYLVKMIGSYPFLENEMQRIIDRWENDNQ